MAKRVVHLLEGVEVNEEHREAGVVAGTGNASLEGIAKVGAVGETSQPIVQCQVANALLVTLAARYIARDHAVVSPGSLPGG